MGVGVAAVRRALSHKRHLQLTQGSNPPVQTLPELRTPNESSCHGHGAQHSFTYDSKKRYTDNCPARCIAHPNPDQAPVLGRLRSAEFWMALHTQQPALPVSRMSLLHALRPGRPYSGSMR